jgi:steroid delta-isomerase-like uncharacterized protein
MLGCQRPDPSTDLKPIINTYIEVWNTGDLDALDEIVDPQFEYRITPEFEAHTGIDSLKQLVTYYRTAYPDFHISVDEEIYTSDKVALIWTINATNTGPGIFPPTGKHINVQGMSIYHFTDGKISDEWIAGNNLLWFQQLGFTLTPPDGMEK